ncbi:hypothetical protein EII14_07535 [Alloprevotella sp. OH1205_COT-284]|uniref:beta-N-acetylhexosaminidase n=1 Tax=Alloprevotella sp. OH1205_COT-284 TaxID=2491043 RepID=UPI000F5D6E6C|nr:family 20 glycosylhydrolase [Alloprevotella sp. OH1205_COT-284]RRD77334.1 hypothetical protein EII14_07535 [Alloprevotella sp. OH1205_COT-284]
MFRLILPLLFLLLGSLKISAADFPVVGTEQEPNWYLIRFQNSGDVISAPSSGEVKIDRAKKSADRLWKLVGNDIEGYTFVNQKGLILSVNSNQKNQKLKAVASTSGVHQFFIKILTEGTFPGAFEVHPKGNASVSLNLWGGPNANRGVGLWDNGDPNNAITFVGLRELENLGRISIVPYPAELKIKKEGGLKFTTLNAITYPDEETRLYVEDFSRQLELVSGIKLLTKPTGAVAESAQIRLSHDAAEPAEGYTLNVNDEGIEIKASGKAGFFYALQTLKQMLPRAFFAKTRQNGVDWNVPFVEIDDEPKLEYRGFMLDVARHFFTKEEVKRVLDIMSLYKMNRFHWHLTEDQGWRIEMPKYPRLTEIGSVRAGSFSNPGEGQQFFDDTEYGRGMFYTKADLQEVVAYAKERNIEILPEVDLPGHMTAAIAAYPEFSCNPNRKYEVRVKAGVSHDVLNIGDDKVIEFLKDVMDLLGEVFPYKYVHLGGDECPTDQWKVNEKCLARVKEYNLKGVEELQAWLVDYLGTYLKEKYDKEVFIWDEVILHWDKKKFALKPIVMAWNVAPDPGGKYSTLSPAQVAANMGFKSVYVPWKGLYLDFMQVHASECLVDEPYHGGWGDSHVNSVRSVYSIQPQRELSGREHFGIGVQGNLWTETTNDAQEMEYQLLPRMLALSETGWLPAAKKNWASFYERLQTHDEILDALGYTYAKHFIEPKELTPTEEKLVEARKILTESRRGAVGYPSAESYDALKAAYEAAEASETKMPDLVKAVVQFKNAKIVEPDPSRVYQIVSASTYYKRQFKGSTLYEANNALRFHYTPQIEPEELWSFETANGGFVLKNVSSGRVLRMPNYGANITTAPDNGTVIRVDKATKKTRNYAYIPGVVTISQAEGYSPNHTGRVKRLNAALSGFVNAADSTALCYTGTWYVVEVDDFTAQLQGLSDKCERILKGARPGEVGQPTADALEYLKNEVLRRVQKALENRPVAKETYMALAKKYQEFQLMEKTTFRGSLDESRYYRLRNVWFASQYATANVATSQIDSKEYASGDLQLWQVVKHVDGTVSLISKANGQPAYISSSADGQTLRLGKPYAWQLEEREIEGKSGVCILDKTKKFSWYTNPATWKQVIMKPFWGACTWEFEKTDIPVVSAIEKVQTSQTATNNYDLSGRVVSDFFKGVFINSQGEKIILR